MNDTPKTESVGERTWHSFPTFRKLLSWIFSWRMVRACLFGVVCLVTLIGLFYAEENWRGSWAWNQFRRNLEAKGEKFDWRDFVPPAVPDDQNFAMTPLLKPVLDYEIQADSAHHQVRWRDTNSLNRLFQGLSLQHFGAPTNPPAISAQWKLGQKIDLAAWQGYFRWTPSSSKKEALTTPAITNHFPRAAQPQSPAADVLLALSRFDPEFAELQAASARPLARFPVHYGDGLSTLLPHLAQMKKLSYMVTLRAVAELEAGQSERAFQDVKLSFHLADAVKTEPFGLTHLVRLAIMDQSLQAVWEGLAAHRWSSNQLILLMSSLKTFDLLNDYGRVVRSERSLGAVASTFSDRKQRREFVVSMFGSQDRASTFFATLDFFPKGWFYLNDLTAARFCQEKVLPLISPAEQRAYPTPARAAIREIEEGPARPANAIFKYFGPFMVPGRFARGQTDLNLTLLACALERSWQARQQYPETLSELAPAYLDKIPTDLITGQPLKYRRTDDGKFLLYSVGWDETDDGGLFATVAEKLPRQSDFTSWRMDPEEKGDWVWRYPANTK